MNSHAFALLMLLIVGHDAVGHAQTLEPDRVSCSLREYESLFKQAHRQKLEEGLEVERKQLLQDIKLQKLDLNRERQELTDLLSSHSNREALLPGNWQLLNHSAEGEYHTGHMRDERMMATYKLSLELRVFEDKWTAIPLIDAQTIVSDWSVSHSQCSHCEFSRVALGFETLLLTRQRTASRDDEPWDDFTLVTNRSGLYSVEFKAFVPIRVDRNLHSLQLNFVHAITKTSLRMLHSNDVQPRELSVEPAAHTETVKQTNRTDIHLWLPSTKAITMKWQLHHGTTVLDRLGDDVKFENEVETSAPSTVVHDALHFIDDNIIETLHSFKYALDSEQSLSRVDILVPDASRITSVVAHGHKTWYLTPAPNATQGGVRGSLDQNAWSMLHIEFKSSMISKDVVVMVTTQTEFKSHAELISIPTAICQGVLRQAGTLAVVKVANVEIYEHLATGLTQISSDSVPVHMKSRTSRPVVLAYKFVDPNLVLSLSLIRHDELPTLDAVVDTALYKALVVDKQIMHSFMLRLQNTRRQYMEMKGIPPNANLWAVKVNSLGTKAVRGREGSLLVPLLVGSGFDANVASSKTSVELVWSTTSAPFGENGTLKLDPPKIDLPISALSCEIQFPEKYTVNFTSSMTRVDRFSQVQPSPVSYETGDDVVPTGFDFNSMPSRSEKRSSNGIRAVIPKIGKRYLLEELLVINGSAFLDVEYALKAKLENVSSWYDQVSTFLR